MDVLTLTKLSDDVYARVDSQIIVHELYRPNNFSDWFATVEGGVDAKGELVWMVVPKGALPYPMPPEMVKILEEARAALPK